MSSKGQNYIVTGGTGFLGSAITTSLVNSGAHVFSIATQHDPKISNAGVDHVSCDLTNECQTREALGGIDEKIDGILHCAAIDGNAAFKQQNNELMLNSNVRMGVNVLEYAKTAGVRKLAFISSTEVGQPDDLAGKSGYVRSKAILESLCSEYSKQCGMRIAIPRLSNLYGPGDRSGRLRGRVIPTMIGSIMSGRDIEIWGDGTQTRSFMYIEDAVFIILGLLGLEFNGVINVASPEVISIAHLAETIYAILGQTPAIIFHRDKPIGPMIPNVDVEELHKTLVFDKTTLQTGLESTVQWFRDNRGYVISDESA